MKPRFRGLIAAPFTPFNPDMSLNLDVVPLYARLLRENGVGAAFICGTTGEGLSMTSRERMQVAEAWMKCAGDLRVIVHTGHNCLEEARDLTRHAAQIGAAAVSAMGPCFFRPRDQDELADWCAPIAAEAPGLPFYYYHIPSMTGVAMKMAPLLGLAGARIPSFAGIKYTHEDLDDYEECVNHENGRFDILFGRDELLMEGWARRALGAVGSTYNYAAPLYIKLLKHVGAGETSEARKLQDKAIRMIATCCDVGVTHFASSKSVMAMLGVDCGPARPPLRNIAPERAEELRHRLEQEDFFSTACAVS
ncbi:dihydrodipicolinate synthase family protein [Termitidicoccus mucosus]